MQAQTHDREITFRTVIIPHQTIQTCIIQLLVIFSVFLHFGKRKTPKTTTIISAWGENIAYMYITFNIQSKLCKTDAIVMFDSRNNRVFPQ